MTKLSKNNSEMDSSELEQTQPNNSNASSSATQDAEQKKLNEIRDLLFGQNVQEYRSEFEELKGVIQENRDQSDQSLTEFKTDVLERLEKLEHKLSGTLTSSSQSFSERLDELNENKVDRKTVASILHQLASQLES